MAPTVLSVIKEGQQLSNGHPTSPRSIIARPQGMSATETLEFVLGCYDFDGTGRLTIDEITLAFKSTVTGMCKLEGGRKGVCPRDTEFEAAAMDIFEDRTGPDRFKVKVGATFDAVIVRLKREYRVKEAFFIALFHDR